MIRNNLSEPSLIEQLAIRLSPQAGKSLVIPRRRESSRTNTPRSGQKSNVGSLLENLLINWIPACAGMTGFWLMFEYFVSLFILLNSVNALADESEWKTSWDGMFYAYASSTNLRNDSMLNPGNYLAKLAQRTDSADARFNFKIKSDSLQLTARPILLTQQQRNSFGDTNKSEGYLSQWQASWRTTETLALNGGRELLNWGPAQFRSPSNPYYFNNGRSNPMAELSGMDTLRLAWSPLVSTSVYVARIYDSGYGQVNLDPWSNSWLVKADWRGDESAVGIALAKQEQQSLFVGLHAQRTVADAWLLYTEAGSYTLPNLLFSPADVNQPFMVTAESSRRTDELLGAAYTFENGQTLTAEYMHYEHGFNAAEGGAYFARAANAASAFPSGNSVPVLASALTYAPSLLGRDYLYLVWQTNLMESTGYARVMFTHNLTDNSNELDGYSEYTVNPHLSVFGLATFTSGGAQSEFARLYEQMLTVGVKVALP
jgi:hypothetical protein